MNDMNVHHEDEFTRVIENRCWYVIEDKTLAHKEIIYTGETRTGIEMRMEFALVGGEMRAYKIYLPKDKAHLQLALNMSTRISKMRRREKERYAELF